MSGRFVLRCTVLNPLQELLYFVRDAWSLGGAHEAAEIHGTSRRRAATWPLAARAQQPTMALVGLLSGNQLDQRLFGAIRQGLKDAGYIEGRNVAIKYSSADGRFDRFPALAAELGAH